MMTLSPALSFLGLFKMALSIASPLLVGFAGVILYKHCQIAGRSLLFAAALILTGAVGPMIAPDTLRPAGVNLMLLACSAGWFLAGVTLALMGFNYRPQEAVPRVAAEPRR